MIFRNKYKRRIQIALLKANMKLKDIEREKAIYHTYKQVQQICTCIIKIDKVKSDIALLEALLKGKDVNF